MAEIKPLVGFGLAFIGAGFFWKLFEDTINDFIIKYVNNTADKYYLMSDLVWNSLPYIVIFVGIVCLIFGAAHSSSTGDD